MIPWVYNDGGQRASGIEEHVEFTGGCFIRAVAIALELPYANVFSHFAEEVGTRRTAGAMDADYGCDILEEHGWVWMPPSALGVPYGRHKASTERTIKHCDKYFSRYMIWGFRHVFAVVEGVIQDHSYPMHHCKGAKQCWGAIIPRHQAYRLDTVRREKPTVRRISAKNA